MQVDAVRESRGHAGSNPATSTILLVDYEALSDIVRKFLTDRPVGTIRTFLDALGDPIYRKLLTSRSHMSGFLMHCLTNPSLRPMMTAPVVKLLA